MLRKVDNLPVLTPEQRRQAPDLEWVDSWSRLLDTWFQIPGTKIRFGADFLIGLVPGAGDLLSLGLSGLLIATMAKNGASVQLVVRMLFNVLLDSLVGAIPILGDVFDLFYKANYRNLQLMREYYDVGKHRGSVWPLVGFVLFCMLLMLAVTVGLMVFIYNGLNRLLFSAVA